MPEPQAVERVTGKTLHAFFFDRYHLRLIEFTKADTWGVDRHKSYENEKEFDYHCTFGFLHVIINGTNCERN